MQWEYYTLVLGAQQPALFGAGGQVDPEEFDRQMNKLGRQGWELVTGLATSGGGVTQDVVLIFKRPRLATAAPAGQ